MPSGLARSRSEERDLKVDIIAPSGRYMQGPLVAHAVAGYLREVGVTATIGNPTDWATYMSTIYAQPENANHDMGLLGFGASYNDPSQALSLFQSSNIPPNGFNASFYKNEEVDRLMSEALTNSDQKVRADLYCQVQNILVEDAPSIWLYVQSSPIIAADVEGIAAINLWFDTTYARPTK
ncbi:hypothetical protein [Chelativorans sp. Marseille-P2723]|uniref:hypothetical protein n=1 Tax=Chelativorans sp. Marseille-P2723 TaxID=2709133 RepID=UPI00157108FE|nr:hypothetical protein [Chelativorans sp. Marseille-P2723]